MECLVWDRGGGGAGRRMGSDDRKDGLQEENIHV